MKMTAITSAIWIRAPRLKTNNPSSHKIKRIIPIIKGKVSKQPPKYERMVAWDGQRNARDAVTVRVG